MPSFGRSTTLVGGATPVGGGTPLGGSGTAGRLAKFTAGTTLGDSLLSESGQDVTINTGRLVINRGTITALSPALDVTTTWNNAAVTFTGMRYNVTDTASNAASLLLDLQVGGASRATVSKAGSLVCAGSIRSGSSIFLGGSTSYALVPGPSGGIIEQYNSTNAQTFNIYNTYTSSTNYERGFLSWVSNEFRIGTEKGSGGGSARALGLYTDGTFRLGITTAGLVQVAGATSSFPALKRSSATLECRLADDSAFAAFGAEWLSITDGITAPAAVAGRARIYVDSADGDLKVVFADGTVKTIVTDT